MVREKYDWVNELEGCGSARGSVSKGSQKLVRKECYRPSFEAGVLLRSGQLLVGCAEEVELEC